MACSSWLSCAGSRRTEARAATFEIARGRATWKRPLDAGSAPYAALADYNRFDGTTDLNADLIETLVASPNKTLPMLPRGKVPAEARTGSIVVGKAADLVLVEGDPSRDIGDLRHTRTVR